MIQSMTGFARSETSAANAKWVWELRSVNGKALDVRFRLPSGMDQLEQGFREVAARHLQRGNIQASLQIEQLEGDAVPTLNDAAFDAALTIARRAAQIADLPMPAIDSILNFKGVVEYAVPSLDEAAATALNTELLASFENAIELLAAARAAEGTAIARVVSDQIERIESITGTVKGDPSRSADAIRERLAGNVARLMESSAPLDDQRLYQEAAILATKADLQEEIDRLEAHIAAARALLASDGAIGRKLDFLAQEFNRECNTICSKSNASTVTAAGLEMKVVIDQFREQIQNLQ